MTTDQQSLANKVDKLEQEIAELKTDTRELQKILMTVEQAESKAGDEKDMQVLDQQLQNM